MSENATQAFVGANSFVYYDPTNVRSGVIGPDMYVVNGGAQSGQSKWVVWEEGGLMPSLAVELLSPKTEANDRGKKFCIYRDILQTQDYILFDTRSKRFEGFRLAQGAYVTSPMLSNPNELLGSQWIACTSLPLWIGIYKGWLRWFDPARGILVWTDEELANMARLEVRAERQRADLERARREKLEARMRELGLEID